MSFASWLRSLRSYCRLGKTARKSRRAARCRSAKRFRPHLEALEDRCLPSFTMSVDYGSDLSAQAMVSADFNGDGKIDLATANREEHTVSVLLGNGDGTFQAARTSGTGLYPETLVAADLNGDGRADLVTLHNRNLSVLLANGDGTFQPPQTITPPAQFPTGYTGSEPLKQEVLSVAIGDFDSDGKLDLVAGGRTIYFTYGDDPGTPVTEWHIQSYANVLLGNGDGTFRPAAVKHLPGGYPLLHPGDFNNDGRLDVVLNGGAYLGNGDGTLQDFVPSDVRVVDVPNPVRDFNGDGKLDVLSDTQTGPVLWLGNGDGTFQPGEWLDLTGHWHSTVAGDVNADGKLDIAVIQAEQETSHDEYGYPYVSATALTARVLLGYGDGTFAEPVIADLGTLPGLSIFESPVLADFDGDGFPDLAAVERNYEDPYGWGTASVYRGVHVALNDGIWTLPPPPPPSIIMSDVTVIEGNAGTGAATFTVTLSGAYDQPVSVTYATVEGTATAGSDYQAVSNTLTFVPGETSKTITVLVSGDRLGESNEIFFVNLSSPTNAVIADGQGVGTIVDDEPLVSISDFSKSEGKNGQTTLFNFTITLSASYDVPVTLNFATSNGTAKTSDDDYVANSGTITFAPGQTTKTITIVVKGDRKKEANENFFVDLSDLSSYAVFLDPQGMGTIQNDD